MTSSHEASTERGPAANDGEIDWGPVGGEVVSVLAPSKTDPSPSQASVDSMSCAAFECHHGLLLIALSASLFCTRFLLRWCWRSVRAYLARLCVCKQAFYTLRPCFVLLLVAGFGAGAFFLMSRYPMGDTAPEIGRKVQEKLKSSKHPWTRLWRLGQVAKMRKAHRPGPKRVYNTRILSKDADNGGGLRIGRSLVLLLFLLASGTLFMKRVGVLPP